MEHYPLNTKKMFLETGDTIAIDYVLREELAKKAARVFMAREMANAAVKKTNEEEEAFVLFVQRCLPELKEVHWSFDEKTMKITIVERK